MRYEIRQLHAGEVLDQAVALTRDNFKTFFWITVVLFTPVTIVYGMVGTFLAPYITTGQPGAPAGLELDAYFWTVLPIGILVFLIYWIFVYPLSMGAITHAIASAYLGRPATFRGAYARSFRIVLQLFATNLLAFLAIVAASMCCLLPGIYPWLIFLLASPVVVIEGVWEITALKRSYALMKGNILTAVVVGLLLLAIDAAIFVGTLLIPLPQFASIAASLIQSGFFVFSTAVWVVFYFSCRCKAENFDLALLVDAVAHD